jgi:hypothetical protein
LIYDISALHSSPLAAEPAEQPHLVLLIPARDQHEELGRNAVEPARPGVVIGLQARFRAACQAASRAGKSVGVNSSRRW